MSPLTILGISGNTYLLRSHIEELSDNRDARMVCYILICILVQVPDSSGPSI
jgi:hypothetical protein